MEPAPAGLVRVGALMHRMQKRLSGLADVEDNHTQRVGCAFVVSRHPDTRRLHIRMPRAHRDRRPALQLQRELTFQHIHRHWRSVGVKGGFCRPARTMRSVPAPLACRPWAWPQPAPAGPVWARQGRGPGHVHPAIKKRYWQCWQTGQDGENDGR